MSIQLICRKAQAEDVELLYKWSNDDLVRKQSFNTERIPFESHCKWFEGKLKDQNTLIYIMEIEAEPASVVRFEIGDENTVIGISISAAFRGKGLGKNLIMEGVDEYFKKNKLPVVASIKKDNIASIKSFEKAGFSFLKEEIINNIDSVVYQKEK